jgi:hypothetical protein
VSPLEQGIRDIRAVLTFELARPQGQVNTFIFMQKKSHTPRGTRPGHFPCEMIL